MYKKDFIRYGNQEEGTFVGKKKDIPDTGLSPLRDFVKST